MKNGRLIWFFISSRASIGSDSIKIIFIFIQHDCAKGHVKNK